MALDFFMTFGPERASERAPISVPAVRSFAIDRPEVILGLVLVLALLVLYNPAGHHPFISFDDDDYITNNPHVQEGLSWSSFQWAFATTAEANWHPLTWISHELDWQLFGPNPAGHHYVSVLWHTINTWVLFMVLLQATGSVWRSWMVAALFAFHPINVESVAWAAERKNLLSMFFFLVALAAYRWYTQNPGLRRYALVTILFSLGLLSKPQVITFPFVLLLWDYWPLQRMRSGHSLPGCATKLSFSRLVLEKFPLFLLSAASAVITLKAQAAGGAIRTASQLPMSVRIANAIVSYARYLQKAFWPAHLSVMYPYLWSWARVWPLVVSLLVLGVISGFVIAAKRRYLLMGWLWFLGTLVPMIGVVQVGSQAMADRYAYLPFIGIFVMVAWGLAEVAEWQRWPLTTPVLAALIVLMALGVAAHRQLGYWTDNDTLWSHAIEVTGPNFKAQEHLGTALANEGRIAEAAVHFRVALAIDGRDPEGYFNLAVTDQLQGRIQQAIGGYNAVLRRNPDAKLKSQTLNNLAMAYREGANFTQAEVTYTAAVQADPTNYKAWLAMGLLEQKMGNFSQAAQAFSQSAELQPSVLDYLLLEKSLQAAGRRLEAVAAHEKAQHLSSDLRPQEQIADSLLAQ